MLPRLFSRCFEAFTAAAFPSQCVECGGLVEARSDFASVCVACCDRVQLVREPKCLTCGFPFFGETESKAGCMHCEHLSPVFGQGWSVSLFRGPVRHLIHELKYERGFWALRDIAAMARLGPGLREFVGDAILLPVPLHARKMRERGYNQSELIVRELAKVFPDSEMGDVLERRVDTVSQTRFNRRERVRNLKNAFSLRRNRAIQPGRRYVIVDDVFTTGSTLNACAHALEQAGAGRIDVLTIGHG
ncbi:ComF family protein [Pelagicoccus sp. SDUM812003]|uniref:ComF family protein n=1 Tax=Pelagicoccus sp. SDUM812003 TaxID=3041267 RepID=UPI00280F7B0D|nr:ComF family protein [Pelagicoccus sp. SDUM812003]MDQ8203669.1 ComF family protein [Pelagicoccus sp. SDUM812003]